MRLPPCGNRRFDGYRNHRPAADYSKLEVISVKSKKALLITAAAFVVLIAGAAVLYGILTSGNSPELLSSANPSAEDSVSQDPSPSGESSQAQSGHADSSDEVPELQQAPDFTVYSADGSRAQLSDFFGKPIVLNFWSSWCVPCKSEMPHFQELYQELGEDVHFLMVNMTDGSRETIDTAQEYIAEEGYTFPVYFDTDYSASITYGVYALPTTFFIDSEGYFAAYAMSALDMDTLKRGIDMIYTAQ